MLPESKIITYIKINVGIIKREGRQAQLYGEALVVKNKLAIATQY
jgi:hypothetical protein